MIYYSEKFDPFNFPDGYKFEIERVEGFSPELQEKMHPLYPWSYPSDGDTIYMVRRNDQLIGGFEYLKLEISE